MRLRDGVEPVREHAGRAGYPDRIGPGEMVPGQFRLRPPGARHTGPLKDPRSLRFRKGDILFCSLRPDLNRLVWTRAPGCVSPEIFVLRPRVHPGRALAALAHRQTLASLAQRASGTRMPRIRWEALADLPMPPVDEPAADAVLALFERLGVLHDRDAAEVDWLRLRAEQSAADGPRLGDVAEVRGPPFRRGQLPDGLPVVRTRDLPRGGLAVHPLPGERPTSSCGPVARGDLLVSRIRPGSGAVGVAAREGVATAEISSLHVLPEWRTAAAARLCRASTAAHLARVASGTSIPRVSAAQLLDLRLARAPMRELDLVIARLERSPALAVSLREGIEAVIHGAAWAKAAASG